MNPYPQSCSNILFGPGAASKIAEIEVGFNTHQAASEQRFDLVKQTCGRQRQYPDGFMLFLCTMFSPIQDREAAGKGFTHRMGDRVTFSKPSLGSLINHVHRSDVIAHWNFGIRALCQNLAASGSFAPSARNSRVA